MKKAVRIIGIALVAFGLVVALFALYEEVGTGLIAGRHQSALREDFDRLVLQRTADSEASHSTPLVLRGQAPAQVRGEPIARLLIPKIRVRVIAVEGIGFSELSKGPGRYPASSWLGQLGSTAIAGHRTGWGGPFVNLDRLAPDDEIILETPERLYTYRVTGSIVVQPNETWVLAGDPQSQATRKLTLTTCTPKFTTLKRLVVWADLIASRSRAGQSTSS